MKETRILMGMTITVEILDASAHADSMGKVFDYFTSVDERFSTYKEGSEISRINRGEIDIADASEDMRTVLALCDATKKLTNGYFDIVTPKGTLDPSGLVKGWAILHAAKMLEKEGYEHFSVDAGGDIQVHGKNAENEDWRIGIRNPFRPEEIVKVVRLPENAGMATSGTYVRGQHIYNPYAPEAALTDIVSITVVAPNVYEADRFATAAFAMGREGIRFIESLPGFEGYAIDAGGIATMTSGFERYTAIHA
jgi:thiamine biosynthesis lipoprotein